MGLSHHPFLSSRSIGTDTGIWTKILTTGEGPSARFSVAGDCLDPLKGGVLVFVGGCNKSLEALDDMYFLYTGWYKQLIFHELESVNLIESKSYSRLFNLVLFSDARTCKRKCTGLTEVGEVISEETVEAKMPRAKSF